MTSRFDFQASQADFYPLPLKQEVVLEPVKEWNRGIAREASGTRDAQMALTLISWKCFPIPKLIQTFAEGCKDNNSLKSPIIFTTTRSVSTVRIRTWLCPLLRTCRTCTAIPRSRGRIFAYLRTRCRENIFSWIDLSSPPYFLETENLLLSQSKEKIALACW